MSDIKPDTIPVGTIESCLLPTSVDESEFFSDEQLQIDPNVTESSAADNIGSDADELMNNADGAHGTERCGAEVVDASVGNESEEFDHQVSDLEDVQNPCDTKNELEKVTINSVETNCTDAENEESTSEVTEVLEKIVNEVDSTSANRSKSSPTAQDENEGGDAVQNTTQVQSDVSATANDAHTKADEIKDGYSEQIQTADVSNAPPKDNTPSVGGEILFTDQGWSQCWAAFPDKQLSFTAPVLRVEAGRFFWSSETYNKR
jgi:hypothetical protein